MMFIVVILFVFVLLVLFLMMMVLMVFDIVDVFVNFFGIMVVVLIVVIVVVWFLYKFFVLVEYLNCCFSFCVGIVWKLFVGVFVLIVFGYFFISELIVKIFELYSGYLVWFFVVFGWGMVVVLVVLVLLLLVVLWSRCFYVKDDFEYDWFLV